MVLLPSVHFELLFLFYLLCTSCDKDFMLFSHLLYHDTFILCYLRTIMA